MNVDELARKVSAADPVAGDQVGILRASIEASPDHGPPHGRKAGLVVGKLNEVGLSTGDRHAFSLVTTGVKSSKKWTEADAASILFWLEEGGADHVQRIANAVVHVLYDASLDIGDVEERDSLEAGKRRMDELLEKQQRKESETMGLKVAALVKTFTSGKYAALGEGQVIDALGVEDFGNEFQGTFDEAREKVEALLGANARGGDVPAQEPEVAPESEDEGEVEKDRRPTPAPPTRDKESRLGQLMPALSEPFDPDAVYWKPQATTKDKSRAMAVAYADPRCYQDRLNEVVGADWSDDYEVLEGGAVVLCRLTVCGVTRSDIGEADQVDQNTATSALAQAFKRAAVKFGVGRYLYDLPRQWVDYDAQKRRFTDAGLHKLKASLVGSRM